jgi:sulfate transport system permease protein
MHGKRHSVRTGAALTVSEPLWLRCVLIALACGLIGSIILVPLVYVFHQALQDGWGTYVDTLVGDAETRHAIWLTLSIAPIAVALNTVFGLAFAWTVTRFRFPGRSLLLSFVDVPFAISPVVAGLLFVLLFGMQGYFGQLLRDWGIQIIFSWPGLVLATTFVTMPFVARELIPLMQSLGSDEELAAVSLGANSWQLFWRITLPNIRWGLLYGIIQCNARAMGEFGAVSVVSGHISGETETMPLRVEKLFQEYDNPGAFAVATLLTLMALATLIGKVVLERHLAAQAAQRLRESQAQEPIP